ncbi:non-specific lipid-transfer protein 1-like [Rhodamnia argentea]|uniref:Non-specific lipid-transfer protein n=1 Tax=Rhodamnia argentea TaxID=178133 RepID=A0A8B8PWD6_9MYRT|nr:non-specific lipid-transfer protein 1-like [Rhodamnia argentea]
MADLSKLSCFLLLACLVAASSPVARAAITCSQVTSSLAPCLGYLMGGGALSGPCCSGVQSLNGAARTTPDRQATCRCLQSAAGSMPGVNLNLAAGLPGKCGVNVPYKISPSTNCNSVK